MPESREGGSGGCLEDASLHFTDEDSRGGLGKPLAHSDPHRKGRAWAWARFL